MVDQNNVLTAPSCQEIWREDCMQRCMQTLQQGLPREQVLKTHLQMTCLVWLSPRQVEAGSISPMAQILFSWLSVSTKNFLVDVCACM